MAPEVIRNEPYSASADIWSLGITLIECLEQKPPLFEMSPMQAAYAIGSGKEQITVSERYSKSCQDFISKCLQVSTLKRPIPCVLLCHPFLKKRVNNLKALMTDAGYQYNELGTSCVSESSRLNTSTPIVAEIIEDGKLQTEEAILIVPPKKT